MKFAANQKKIHQNVQAHQKEMNSWWEQIWFNSSSWNKPNHEIIIGKFSWKTIGKEENDSNLSEI
jgi:hypothetical protein